MKNWLNDTSREINGKLRDKRLRSPSITLRYKWKEEFIALGLDKKQSFASYLKYKTKLWHKSKQFGKNSH